MTSKEYKELARRVWDKVEPTDTLERVQDALEPILADYDDPMDLVMVGVVLGEFWDRSNIDREDEEDEDDDSGDSIYDDDFNEED